MNIIVFPIELRAQGSHVADLHDALYLFLERDIIALADLDRREVPPATLAQERATQTFGAATQKLVIIFQRQRQLEPTGVVDEPTAKAMNALLEEFGALEDGDTFEVDGQVSSRVSAGVSGLQVRVVDKTVDDDVQLAETVTGRRGEYVATFTGAELRRRGKDRPDLQARVYAGDKFLAASEVRYNAAKHETLDVLLDAGAAAALESEYETLIASLTPHLKGKLGDIEETEDRQGITYLARKTGWDARAIALAVLAEQFSGRSESSGADRGLEPPFFYALFRAGIPATDALYRTDAKTVEAVWRQAIAQGVIPAGLESKVPAAVKRFQSLATEQILEGAASRGVSPLKDIVAVSLGEDSRRQKQFAELYTRYGDDLPKFWKSVQETFGKPAEKRLRVDGQLAYLTGNNAPLIRKLHDAGGQNGITDPANLVEAGFYRTEKWRELVADGPIPAEVPGENEVEKRDRYAEELAAQVRLSFPTAVVAQMVKSRETPLANELVQPVHDFLAQQEGKFEIGLQPVEQYVAQHQLTVAPNVIKAVSRLQRVYQITPNDDSMNGLLRKGVDSAYGVVRYDRDEFVEAFKDEVGGETSARLIYAKSEQVHNAVLNIAASYLTAYNAPAVGVEGQARVISPAPEGTASLPAPANDVIAYATLEGLLGEMDYCECQHCRSILSPAAYLVDLLLFLDRPTVPTGTFNPQTVLFQRRPDIQHLPLTCENTNTPLPYIDLVNETLEYYITSDTASTPQKSPMSMGNYPGHTTDGSATGEELLASPTFVREAAYTTLANADFPPPLPFHQPLENLRRYFAKLGGSLPRVMEDLRRSEAVERPTSNPPDPTQYGWRDILMEELRLSRAEYRLLTDSTVTVRQLYGYPAASGGQPAVPDELRNAKTFARRVGITYEELIEVLKTRFVNPHSTLIPRLERLGVSFADLKSFKDAPGITGDAAFINKLAPQLDPDQYGGNIKAWVKNQANYDRIMGLITLKDPDNPTNVGSFDNLELRYSNPDASADNLGNFEFVRLIRFIRLWKKLGWTIEQTDQATTALYPAEQIPDDASEIVNRQRLDAGFLELLPKLGQLRRIMDVLEVKPHKDLPLLLACFAPIDTHGPRALYRQLFLRAALPGDTAFLDDGYGNFLANNTAKLFDHRETLRAGLQVTGDELDQIMAALEYDEDTALTIQNVSAILRRGWLARKLKLSVREFLLLTKFTGLDPFAPPDPPQPPLQRLLQLLARLREVSLTPNQALYLIWNQDLSGKSAPADAQILGFARTLRSGLAAIDSEFAIDSDPEGRIAYEKMALVYGSEPTDAFFGLLSNSVTTDVDYSHGQPTLKQAILDAADGSITYDDLRKRLSYTAGVMNDTVLKNLQDVGGVTQAFKDAVAELHQKTRAFFDRYPELLLLYEAYAASTAPLEERRSDLLATFLPELARRRKHQYTVQATSAATQADTVLVGRLLDDTAVLQASGDTSRPALDDVAALERPGLSAQIFFGDTVPDPLPDLADRISDLEPNLAYDATTTNTLPAAGGSALSGIWSGFLEVPDNGFYNFHVDADAGATVQLWIDGEPITLAESENAWSNSSALELGAGKLHRISLQVEKVKSTFTVRWESEGRGREVIPSRYLYAATAMDRLGTTFTRLLKAGALATGLRLTAAEIAYLASHPDYQIQQAGWLNSLPVVGSPSQATATDLLKALQGLLDYARIKAELAPNDERLLEILTDPLAATATSKSLLFAVTGWEPAALDVLLTRFGKLKDDGSGDLGALKDVSTFARVYDAFRWVKQLGIPAASLIPATTNEPIASTVRDLRAALRARYAQSDWLSVLKPINDEMRGLQRDALVAYILHRMGQIEDLDHIDTADKLFEYFLMDVQMEPCMQTSRIRHALSSVQLFIERCLMNLETKVSPQAINAKHWEWMSRYRVWEANRKIFLYPENWLDPELRDDQSPFFRESIGELLQSDITEDTAATAMLNYLAKLEEVAKLEPCGIYHSENDPLKANDDVVHVVARTAGANRKYYYRRREYGYWTPWEQIKLEIEDNPVIPVVWKGRLFLFWLTIVQQAALGKPTAPAKDLTLKDVKATDVIMADVPKVKVEAILCWSEYYNGKWQPAKTSDVNRPALLGTFDITGSSSFDRKQLRLAASGLTGPLEISAGSPQGGTYFVVYNSHSLPVIPQDDHRDSPPQPAVRTSRGFFIADDTLTIEYGTSVTVSGTLSGPGVGLGSFGGSSPGVSVSITLSDSQPRPVLTAKDRMAFRIIDPRHSGVIPFRPAFFFENRHHVFYVTTTRHEVKVGEAESYGRAMKTDSLPVVIPPLAIGPPVEINERRGALGTLRHDEPLHPATNTRELSGDAPIVREIGVPGTIRFGDVGIGVAGGIVSGPER